jgi:cold shock CspA family protein
MVQPRQGFRLRTACRWIRRVVERSGHDSVPPGATLEVRAGPGAKGPQVTEILSVDSSTAQQEMPRRERPERPIYPSANQAVVEEIGTVKWYNAAKGFGTLDRTRAARISSCTRQCSTVRASPARRQPAYA